MSLYLIGQATATPSPYQNIVNFQNQSISLIYGDQSFFSLPTLENLFPLVYFIPNLPLTSSSQLNQEINYQVSQRENSGGNQKGKRRICPQKQIKSAKKNGESNLINHLFSFLSQPERSSKTVRKAIRKIIKSRVQTQKIQQLFYNIVRLINTKRGRKYVNRNILLQYLMASSLKRQVAQISKLIDETLIFSLQDLCSVFRIVCFQFTRNQSINVVLTSKRISSVAKPCHLERKRLLEIFLTKSCQKE